MARYSSQITSTTALAVDTGFAWLMASASNGYKLRRVTLGVTAAGTPTSQQITVGINRVTTAGTTPVAGMTPGKLDPNSTAAGSVWNSGYTTPPTVTANDQFRVTFNSLSGADLPWEGVEEFAVALAVTNGLVFINRNNALPTGHALTLTVEHEE